MSYQNGNTLDGPSQCDKTAIQKTESANFKSGSGGGGGGGGDGQGGGNAGCAGPPPNDTCSCDATGNYVCDCPGLPPTCSDLTEGVCFNSNWTCGTVTTSSCTGAAPTCPDGSTASCDNDQWTCPPNDCSDPCNPACSNYDPADPSCSGGCDPSVDPTCGGGGGGCDPSVDPSCGGGGGGGACDTDCCLSVTPCDIACDMVVFEQRKFWTVAPVLSARQGQQAVARQQCTLPPTKRAMQGAIPPINDLRDIVRIAGRLKLADVLDAPRTNAGNLTMARISRLTADAPSRGASETPISTSPVTIVEFSDFECPYCERMAATLLKQVLPEEGGDVRLVYKHFPLPMHAWAREAAEISECARNQNENAFWQLHDFFFERQRSLRSDTLENETMHFLGGNPAINAGRLQACIANHETRDRVLQDMSQGQQNGVHGTPTLFINGIRVTGAQNADLIRKAIAQARAEQTAASNARVTAPLAPGQAQEKSSFCNPFTIEGSNPCLF